MIFDLPETILPISSAYIESFLSQPTCLNERGPRIDTCDKLKGQLINMSLKHCQAAAYPRGMKKPAQDFFTRISRTKLPKKDGTVESF